MADEDQTPAVGIDLGTTFSAIAYLNPSGSPETIQNAEGNVSTPSAVFFDKSTPIVGIEAIRAGEFEPERLAYCAKRDMGELAYSKPIRDEFLPAEVVQALVLKKLKADAEQRLGPFTKAVVTVPAFFNEPCRKATQDAGRLAGLDVIDIINEPTAAAITYGFGKGFLTESGESRQLERILVFDLGGGTFDVTIMEIDGPKYTAIATGGDVYLGGYDWDSRLAAYLAEKYLHEFGTDIGKNKAAMQSLLRTANEAKHALSARSEMMVFYQHDGKQLRLSLTREKFEELTDDLVDRTILTVRMVMSEANLKWSDLTRVLLVGGSTRMPMIEKALQSESGMQLDRSVSPDEAVAHGAAIYAGLLIGSSPAARYGMSVINVNSHDLGVLAIERSTKRHRKQVMIRRNSVLPSKQTMRFKTHSDNQSNVKVEIIEGGDDSGQNAIEIGKLVITDLPPDLPKDTAVDVEFQYEQNGRLIVNAWLPTADRDAKLELDRAAGLTDEAMDEWKQRIDQGMADAEDVDLKELERILDREDDELGLAPD